MYDQFNKRGGGGYRGSPRGGRGGRGGGGWGQQQGGWGQQSAGYYGGRGGAGGRGGQGGGYRNEVSNYRGGGGYRGNNYRGNSQNSFQPRGGYNQNVGGYRGARGAPVGSFNNARGGAPNFRGSFDHNRIGQPGQTKFQGGRGGMTRKSDSQLFEEGLDLGSRKRMVKVVLDNKITKADFAEFLGMDGVSDLHMSGHMLAEYETEKEDFMLEVFPEVERLTQNGVPCYADLTGRRSKNYGKETIRDLRRVDIRNLPEKTSVELVKEAFPNADAVWKNNKYNCVEMLFENEEEACEAILSGQQKEINGVLPFVMFHRENQANLEKKPIPTTPVTPVAEQPPTKKQKVEEANGEAMDGVVEEPAAVEA